MSLVDSQLSVMCAPFVTSCEVMDFAETGHRQEKHPDLPVSSLMVLNAWLLECEKSQSPLGLG